MSDKKSQNNSEVLQKGYQPSGGALKPNTGPVHGGYQPTTSEAKPINPPPKKP